MAAVSSAAAHLEWFPSFCVATRFRAYRAGHQTMSNQNVSTEKRFVSNLPERRTPAACWEWQGATSNGYGILNVGGKKTYAHRFSVLFHGRKIRHGFVVDHLCSNRRCVNPAHLEVVTMQENARRGVEATTKRGRKRREPNRLAQAAAAFLDAYDRGSDAFALANAIGALRDALALT